MVDLAHQYITQPHPGGNRRDYGPYGGWACPWHGSIYDSRGRVLQSSTLLSLAVSADEFAGGTTIKIG
jgi:Rieske Fe-S protein